MQIDIPVNRIIKQFLFPLPNVSYIYIAKYILKQLFKNLLFSDYYYILCVDLDSLRLPKASRLTYSIGIADKGDLESLVDRLGELEWNERKEIATRVFFAKAGFRHCYLGRAADGQPVYMQWLIYPDENEIIAKHFRSRFYPLKPNQIMLENAFTFPRFRGLGPLPSVSAELLTIARDQGYKTAVAYIQKNQLVSLNEFMNMNFKIRKIVREYKILGVTKRML